jgi:uncharacterized protein with von Willebrand factor type A (vWA) domain
MFTNFFLELRQAKVPVSIKEYLALMEAMDKHVADYNVDDFYYLSRSILVKDERNLDKFDKVFGHVFKGLEAPAGEGGTAEIPEEWIRKMIEGSLTEEEKALIKALGGWDKLMETLKQRLEEQRGAIRAARNGWHRVFQPFRCGWTATQRASASPDAAAAAARSRSDRRTFRNLDDRSGANTRNIKIALRLRRSRAPGVPKSRSAGNDRRHGEERGLARSAPHPERRNRVKVLLFLDIGGRWTHVQVCRNCSPRRRASSAT